MKPTLSFLALVCNLIANIATLAVARASDQNLELDSIRVEDVAERLYRTGKVKDAIIKTEVVTEKAIQDKQAKTVSQAVDGQAGVDSQANDSLCGIRRVQLNGLRGEYTTLLVDDIPLHSTVSTYYGVDSFSTSGIDAVEISRGSGASLTAPEAIGGAVNIITKRPTENFVTLDSSMGNGSYKNLSITGAGVAKNKQRRMLISAQFDEQGQWDSIGVGVSQSPAKRNYSLLGKLDQDFGAHTHLELRGQTLQGSTFGGPTNIPLFKSLDSNSSSPPSPSFEGGDVRRRYNGDPGGVLEFVEINRAEVALKLSHEFSNDSNLGASIAYADQKQESYYEGSDYANQDRTLFTDIKFNRSIGDHVLTIGQDVKLQRMRSKSHRFFEVLNVTPDSFDHFTPGAYVQDTYAPSARLEIAAAVRVNRVNVNWIGQTAARNEIAEWVAVPRLHVKFAHLPVLTSRLSLGQGYRAPLTFFESEHGILDNGFDVLIHKIERANSAVYSLNYDDRTLSATLSGSYTEVRHFAQVDLDRSPRPALLTHDGKVYSATAEATLGYSLTDALEIGAGYEHFFYSGAYRPLLPIAPIQDRVRLSLGYEKSGWEVRPEAVFIGARDLSPYGYANRYNVYAGGIASQPKSTHAPAFVTIDLRISKTIDPNYSIYVGIKNLLDYTQAKRESPLFYDSNGNLDAVHIWGPMRGRQLYAGLRVKF